MRLSTTCILAAVVLFGMVGNAQSAAETNMEILLQKVSRNLWTSADRPLPLAGDRWLYSEALRRELTLSGYTMHESGLIPVTGSVARFFVDWRETERVFELRAVYTKARSGFTWECSSIQRGPNTLVQDGVLIRRGTADCMHRFIQAAQNPHIL